MLKRISKKRVRKVTGGLAKKPASLVAAAAEQAPAAQTVKAHSI